MLWEEGSKRVGVMGVGTKYLERAHGTEEGSKVLTKRARQ